MKARLFVCAVVGCAPLFLTDARGASDADGALTPEFLSKLREGYRMDRTDELRHNAITQTDIKALALSRKAVRGEDGHFSHKIKIKGITNQKASGRCWMFAGFNVMRPKVIHDQQLEEFTFSTSYLQFWDKMEKSNLYLETVIELRDVDYTDREWNLVNRRGIGDGGWWNYVSDLIEKYGVVPTEVMPETQSSENTATMNLVLSRLLRAEASKLLASSREGASVEQLRAGKEQAMAQVYRFLVINLGTPPTEFEWRYLSKKEDAPAEEEELAERSGTPAEAVQEAPQLEAAVALLQAETEAGQESGEEIKNKQLSHARKFTPQGFYEEFVGVPLRDYVCLYNDPKQTYGGHYRFERSINMAGAESTHFVNIESELLKEITTRSILANEPVWFAADVGVDQSAELGLMADELYDYDTLFGIDTKLSKSERTRFYASSANHAMTFIGVDLQEGKATKWLVENSWGTARGDKGLWTLRNDWFTENVYSVIVNRKYVPAEVLSQFDQPAEPLPSWYPGAEGISE